MHSDAIQIAVRGFHSSKASQDIIERLLGFGFEVKQCFDSSSDSMGGLIETQIMPWEQVDADSLEEICQAICFTPEIIVQHLQFAIVEEGTSRSDMGTAPAG
jgi:hypothetical protein